jgi:hypothetical protein
VDVIRDFFSKTLADILNFLAYPLDTRHPVLYLVIETKCTGPPDAHSRNVSLGESHGEATGAEASLRVLVRGRLRRSSKTEGKRPYVVSPFNFILAF